MAIDLAEFEKGEPPDKSVDYDKALKKLQKRLERVQIASRLQRKPAIIVVEGWDAGGKTSLIQRLTAELDPRGLYVFPIIAPTQAEKDHHYLWRFWKRLPGKGEIAIFDRSWYGRVLVERVEGFATAAEWQRAYDEINVFEHDQVDDGATVVKIFLHVSQAFQDEQLVERLEEPWKRWKINADDFRNRARREDYLQAMADMFERTDTRWAPWTVIDGNDRKAARLNALGAIADQLERRLDMTPPSVDPAIVEQAEQALGRSIKLD